MRVKPVGARTRGYASGCPRIVVDDVDLLDPAQHAGPERGDGEGGLVGGEGALVLGGTVDVVEHATGQAALGDAAQVGDRRGVGEAAFDGVGLDPPEADDRAQRVEEPHEGSYLRRGVTAAIRWRMSSSVPGMLPAARAWTTTLPSAVASTGPAITGRPVASAVSWPSRSFCAPPPTMWTTSMSRSASAAAWRMVRA